MKDTQMMCVMAGDGSYRKFVCGIRLVTFVSTFASPMLRFQTILESGSDVVNTLVPATD